MWAGSQKGGTEDKVGKRPLLLLLPLEVRTGRGPSEGGLERREARRQCPGCGQRGRVGC